MKIWILALLIFNVKCQDSPFLKIDDSNEKHEFGDSFAFSNETLIRSERASQEDFSSMVDNLSVSARLITAISLQNGLIDQSIPADKALAELLNIGSVDMEQLEHFDKTKVDGFAKSLSSLAPQLTTSQEQKDVEETLIILNSWARKFGEIGDMADMSEVNKYFVEIGKLKSTVFDVAFLKETTKAIDAVIPSVEGIKELPTDTRTNQAQNTVLAGQLFTMHLNLEVVRLIANKLTSLSSVLDQFKPLSTLNFPYNSPQCKFLDFLDSFYLTRQHVNSFNPKAGTDLAAAIAQVTSLDSETSEVNVLKAAMKSRVAANLSLTSGFLEGAADLQKLDSDAQNNWFGSMSQGYEVEKLASGFGFLKALGTQLTTLSDSWKTLSTPQQLESVQRIVKIHEKIKVAKTMVVGSVTKINDIAAKKPTAHSGFTDNAKKVYQNAVYLEKTVTDVASLVESLSGSKLMKDLESVGKLADLSKFPEDPNKQFSALPDVIDKVKTFTDTGALVENLKKLKPLLEGIDQKLKTPDLNAIVKELANGESTMKTFQSDQSTQSFSTFFTTVKDSAKELEPVEISIRLLREVRELPGGIVQDVEAVTTAFSKTLPGVKGVRGAIVDFKTNKSLEVVELKDLGKESETFGQSVAALDDVRKVLDKKADLEQFLKDCESVEAAIQNEKDPKKKSELLDGWGDFEKTRKELTYLFADLESRRDRINIGSRNRRSTGRFSSYTSAFSAFTGLKSVDLEVEKRLQVLAALNQATLISTLDSLGSLNLNFANSNGPMSQMAGTLGKLDAIFDSAAAAGSATPATVQTPPPPSPQTSQPVPQVTPTQVLLQTLITTTAASGVGTVGLIFIILGSFLLAIVVIVGGWCGWKKHQKNKKNKKNGDLESGENKNKVVPAPPPPPPVSKVSTATVSNSTASVDQAAASRSQEIDPELQAAAERRREQRWQRETAEAAEAAEARAQAAENERRTMEAFQREHEEEMRIKALKSGIVIGAVVKGLPSDHPEEFQKREQGRKLMNLPISWTWSKDQAYTLVYLFDAFRGSSRIPDFIREFAWDVRKYAEVPDSERKTGRTMKEQYFDWTARQPPASRFKTAYVASSRDPQLPCISLTACSEKNGPLYYHGNRIAYPIWGAAYICESPQDDNVTRFLGLILALEMPNVVMCCQLDESARYFPLGMEDGPVIIGNFLITIVENVEDIYGCVQLRHLNIRDNERQMDHRFKHYLFENWQRGQVFWDGEDPDHRDFISAFIHVQKETQLTTHPTLIHSFRGTGRAGVFAGAQFMFQSIVDFRFPPLIDIILLLIRSSRFGLIENGKQLLMTCLITCKWMAGLVEYYSDPFIGLLNQKWDDLRDFSDMGEPERKDREAWERIRAEALPAEKTAKDLSEIDIDLKSPAASEANLKRRNTKKKTATLDETAKSKSTKKSVKSKKSKASVVKSLKKSSKKSLKSKKSKVSVTKSAKKSVKSTTSKSTNKSVKSNKSKVSVMTKTKSKSELKP